ncbi:MAG: ATP-binding protein [Novosphingobium sp. 32-60-15]|uniref:ABC transporter ATP-binding protein n=1 Tax=unclassified Novosphingobium TaxID=2644732 RepID=UPI000BDDA746|nr:MULTISPECIES: ABC transporter ATP-binding protein [unclassified Novosphingobium]OYX62026.1 MAG: ATP-binding protein [Novosphingobium sp. 32-60-15]
MIVGTNLRKVYRAGHGEKLVFDGLDFTIMPGQKVGLLGRNGAGKSTLIKLIGGVEMPTRGKIERHMSVSWPLGFGGGFQGSLSGYDNARFIARIYGKSYRDIRDFVEDFTELGRQLRMPVKTYSSGMRARLAFALSLVIEFDCYMIDEIILVGDQNFQRKCHHELFEKRADRALLVASHSVETIREYCDSALLLDACRGTMYTDVDAALERYTNL